MFTKDDYTRDFAHVHEVHFDEKPDDNVVHSLINRYFGDMIDKSGLEEWPLGASLQLWTFILHGVPNDRPRDRRFIEAALDCDTFCGDRNEPYYFLVRNEAGDDAITLAVAAGLAKFIAKEMNGKLVTNSTE